MCPRPTYEPEIHPLDTPAPFQVWGADDLDEATMEQMRNACRLPVSVRGAQMPDGHVGYGLPIGGVLATRDAVIPYGVGVDIACRMKLSILPDRASRLDGWRDRLRKVLIQETSFGIGAAFGLKGRKSEPRREHDVMDDLAWNDLPPELRRLKDKAHEQLGTSGSGNHFVEFGEFEVPDASAISPSSPNMISDFSEGPLPLTPGKYLALLSHSGSRGFGANIAQYYTNVAMDLTRLPGAFRYLAWLPLAGHAGQEYWSAMQLAGRYASANHDCIHRHVLRAAGLESVLQVENHHNFAWREVHDGEELIVHRKGATPAGKGVLGVIPGTMADPGYLVVGRGTPESLESASHGAGRRMSRAAAKQSLTGKQMRDYIGERGVELISAGLDEAPMAYKDIRQVMAAQQDLVDILATFRPRLVRMADDGKSED